MGGALAIVGPPVMTVLFLGWVLYLLFVKKDARKHRGDIIGGLMIISLWAVIYFVFIT